MEIILSITGPLLEDLLKGAKVIKTGFDGFNHYVLVENPKGSEWKYTQYETIWAEKEEVKAPFEFFKMVTYNHGPKTTTKAFTQDFILKRIHLKKLRPDLLK